MLRRILSSLRTAPRRNASGSGSDRSPAPARQAPRSTATRAPRPGQASTTRQDAGRLLPWTGPVRLTYAPERDGAPDPGEVVWAWVPYEEDAAQGKDRPVVVVGWADDERLAVVPLSSRDHTGDEDWMPVGTGGWDRDGRASSARLTYVLAGPPSAVRREGSALDRARFQELGVALRRRHGW